MVQLGAVTLSAFIPVLTMAIGAGFTAMRPPSPGVRSAIQHFAAGVVFSVVAVELLPDVTRTHSIPEVILGFALGIALMLTVRKLTAANEEVVPVNEEQKDEQSTRRSESEGVTARASASAGLLTAVGVDILLDGVLVGIAFAAGSKEGTLLTLALSLELLSLGLALAADFTSRVRAVLVPTAISLLLVVGAVGGVTVLSHASTHLLAGVLAFGCAALLFLVTEELLVEAHEVPETTFGTAMFFAGFLLFLVLGMLG